MTISKIKTDQKLLRALAKAAHKRLSKKMIDEQRKSWVKSIMGADNNELVENSTRFERNP